MSQRRPKDRSNWGDMAFKAMHDKPSSKPSIRELLFMAHATCSPLAARVERVLTLHVEVGKTSKGSFCRECEKWWPCPTVRALEGKP